MVIHRSEMKIEDKERRFEGEGVTHYVHLVDVNKNPQKNARMFAELTLNPGSSIGYHSHENETEYFFILSGAGTVNDNGEEIKAAAGDAVITGNGAFHSIKNTGAVPLVFHAVVVTH